jgi:hypothetical protein
MSAAIAPPACRTQSWREFRQSRAISPMDHLMPGTDLAVQDHPSLQGNNASGPGSGVE